MKTRKPELSYKYRLLIEQGREASKQVENPALWVALAQRAAQPPANTEDSSS